MSEWPKRYDWDYDGVSNNEVGDYVLLKDFERLLEFTAKLFEQRHGGLLELGKLKYNILLQLKKEAEND
jgi:hypothetical protein